MLYLEHEIHINQIMPQMDLCILIQEAFSRKETVGKEIVNIRAVERWLTRACQRKDEIK